MFKYTEAIGFGDNSSHGIIANHVNSGEHILEFGCATGLLSRYLKEEKNCSVVGVEISEEALKQASPYLSLPVLCDIESGEWKEAVKDMRFDSIIFGDVLEHLRFPHNALRDAAAFLKKDGKVLFSVPNLAHGDVLLKLIDGRFDYTPLGILDDTHIHFFGKDNLPEICAEAGLFLAELTGTMVPVGSTEQKSEASSADLAFIKNKPYSHIYQFIGVAYRADYAHEKGMVRNERLPVYSGVNRVFFDTGEGLCDKNAITFTCDDPLKINKEFPLPPHTVHVRFDPCDEGTYYYKNVHFRTDSGDLFPTVIDHATPYADGYIATEQYPQFTFRIPGGATFFGVYAELVPISAVPSFVNEIVSGENNEKRKLAQTTERLLQEEAELDTLKTEKDRLRRLNGHISEDMTDLKKTIAWLQSELCDRDHILISSQKAYFDNLKEKEKIIDEKSRALSESKNNIAQLQEKSLKGAQAYQELMSAFKEKSEAHETLRATCNEQRETIAMLRAEYAGEKEEFALFRRKSEEENAALRQSLNEKSVAYDTISNAAFWKITKPFRMLGDFLKKIPPVRIFGKFLRSIRRNGPGITFRKIKTRLFPRKSVFPTKKELALQRKTVFTNSVKFSVIVPLYNTNKKYLCEMIESVLRQTYANFELCLADGSDAAHAYVEEIVKTYAARDARVQYRRLEKNGGISENTNACAAMASGDYIALLDHDDLLSSEALYQNAVFIQNTGADVLYSDEDHLSPAGKHINPFYKPDFSPDLLCSQMYICHLSVIRRSLFLSVGGFRPAFDGSQDYDLMLRLSECTRNIVHIPKILYTWRECPGSTAADPTAKPYAHTAGKRALDEHLHRVSGDGAHAEDTAYTFVYDARYPLPDPAPRVSVMIPMKDKSALTDACVQSILEKTDYPDYEVIILDNRSVEEETQNWFRKITEQNPRVRVIAADMEFNWSEINNFGICNATGDVFIFLNNDTVVISGDWMTRLAENVIRPGIGVAGPLLLYPDGTIQHAGVVVGFGGWADHVFKGQPPVHYGAPFVSPMVARNVLAVTGACLAVSRKTIEDIGEFDESFIICGSDIELCLRAYEKGYYNKYEPAVRLYHYESKSRKPDDIPEVDFRRSYAVYTPYRENGDPFYNRNLDLSSTTPKEAKR